MIDLIFTRCALDDAVFAVHLAADGREAFKHFLAQVQTALPDVHAALGELIAKGDKVVARWAMAGTQQGPSDLFRRLARTSAGPGSASAASPTAVIEDRGEEDALGLMQQLGVVPTPEQVATAA